MSKEKLSDTSLSCGMSESFCVELPVVHCSVWCVQHLPEYALYARAAPLKRNITIIENADIVLAFWDGKSKGTKFVIDSCHRLGVEVRMHIVTGATPDSTK